MINKIRNKIIHYTSNDYLKYLLSAISKLLLLTNTRCLCAVQKSKCIISYFKVLPPRDMKLSAIYQEEKLYWTDGIFINSDLLIESAI